MWEKEEKQKQNCLYCTQAHQNTKYRLVTDKQTLISRLRGSVTTRVQMSIKGKSLVQSNSSEETGSLQKRQRLHSLDCETEQTSWEDISDLVRLLARFGFERIVHLLFRQQGVPLRYRAPRIRQHVRPVAQAHTSRPITHEGLPYWVVAPQLVIVVHSDDNLHFLEKKNTAKLWNHLITL